MKIINTILITFLILSVGACIQAMELDKFTYVTFTNTTGGALAIKLVAEDSTVNDVYQALKDQDSTITIENLAEVKEYKIEYTGLASSISQPQIISARTLEHYVAQHKARAIKITLMPPFRLEGFLSQFNYGTLFGFAEPKISVLQEKDEDDLTVSKLERSMLVVGTTEDEYKKLVKALGFEVNFEPHQLFGLPHPLNKEGIDKKQYITLLKSALKKRMQEWAPNPQRDKQKFESEGIKDFSKKIQDIIFHAYTTILGDLC